MAGIFDENNMRQELAKYIPQGETMLAGIHAVVKESEAKCIYDKCVINELGLHPNTDGGTVMVTKTKYSTYDLYFGITQTCFVVADCEPYRYLYQTDAVDKSSGMEAQIVTSDILLQDTGHCFPLSSIQSCSIKKAWMGSMNCSITLKNGSYFKLMFPKMGGVGGGMPNHTKYRETIVAMLGGVNA